MSTRRSLLFAPLLFAAACTTTPAETPSTAPEAPEAGFAITGVNVIPMDRPGVLQRHTVLVSGDRITAVGRDGSIAIPAEAIRIDATGQYLVPGLAEMHGHIPSPQAGPQQIEDVLFLYLSNGVTTVRGMLGAPGQLALRSRAAQGELDSPTLYLAGPSFNGGSIDSPQDAVSRVHEQKREGWDLLKIHPGLTRAEYDAMARTARAEEIRFGGHVPEAVGLLHALESGQETLDHMDGYIEHLEAWDRPVSDSEIAPLVEATRAAGAWIVPTMALWETLFCVSDLETLRSYPELRYVSKQAVAQWSDAYGARLGTPQCAPAVREHLGVNRTRMLRALHEGGVGILMGTDAPQQFSVPGFSLHRELELMGAAGMSPFEIIETGTVNVGRYFASSDSFGAIRPGQRADMILIRENPLESIDALERIEGVMARGRWYSRKEIDARLDQIAARQF